jgi:hypothetical protein
MSDPHSLTEAMESVSLAECPPGLFMFGDTLGFKTEYGATTGKDVGGGKVEWTVTSYSDAYCVESGEVFWGGVSKHEDREKLIVRPLAMQAARPIAPETWMPHLDYAGEPMREGEFRDRPIAPVQDDDAEWLINCEGRGKSG